MKRFFHSIRHFFNSNSYLKNLTLLEISGFIFSGLLFLANYSYYAYPDEFVNLLGGLSILKGQVPYVGFFDHHLPFAWYFSAILLAISFKSFVIFRLLWAFVVFASFGWLGLWIRKHYRELFLPFMIFFIIYPALAVYYWFHLYVGDALAIFFFSLIFWILAVQTFTKRVHYNAILAASLLTFCLVFSSLTYIYMAGVFYLWQLYLIEKNKKNIIKFFLISAAPYVLYFLYLLISGSVKEFYISNFVYNTKLYISLPNYTRGTHFNPLKFLFTIIFNFYTNYLPLLTKIKYLDLYQPVSVVAGLGTLALLLILIMRNIPVAIMFFLILSFSAPRSNIQMANEGDYQGALFLVLGIISSLLALYSLREMKFKEVLLEDIKRIVQILLAVFLFFSAIFLVDNTYNKFFMRYTQKMPSISNTAFAARFIDTIVNKGDYYWIGPYEPQEEFFVKKAQLPGKFISLLPQFREDDYFKNNFIKQFEDHPPKIIIYRHEASIFGTPAIEFGSFFLTWMEGKYTSVEHIPGLIVLGSPTEFNIKSDLYILNSAQAEILQKLRENNYIQ